MTSHKQNVRTLNGTLAITAVHHPKREDPKLIKPFTSGYIYSSQYFTHGKFQVRAAMPKGNLLRAQINLYEPLKHDNTWVGISLVDFKSQPGKFEVGLFETGANFSHYHQIETIALLDQFNYYGLIWQKNRIEWYFNGINVHSYDYNGLNERLRDRLNGQMEFEIDLVVGGPHLGINYTKEQVNNWTCPSILVDYVRKYQLSDDNHRSNITLEELEPMEESISSAEDICELAKQFKNETDDLKSVALDKNLTSFNLMLIFSIVPIILILIAIIVILYRKMKEHKFRITEIEETVKDRNEKDKEENIYTDIRDEIDIYHPFDLNYVECNEKYENVLDENEKAREENNYLDIYDDSSVTNQLNQVNYEIMDKKSQITS